MKKIFFVLVLIVGALSLNAKEVMLNKTVLNKIRNIGFIKQARIVVLKGKKAGELYMLEAKAPRVNKLTVFVTKDFKTVVVGVGFMNGKKLEFLKDMSGLKDKELWTIGNGVKDYYMFTDPECPFCQTLEKNLVNLKKEITLHVFLFPLAFHKHAKSMTKFILSNPKDKRAKIIEAIARGDKSYEKAKYSDEQNEKLNKIIDKNIKLATKLGVNGTPTIFDSKGRNIPWPQILSKKPVMR